MDRPKESDLLWMALVAIRDLGGVARASEMAAQVAEAHPDVAAAYAALPPGTTHANTLSGRLGWSRTRLKELGLAVYRRPHWHLTDSGRQIPAKEVREANAAANRLASDKASAKASKK